MDWKMERKMKDRVGKLCYEVSVMIYEMDSLCCS